MTDKKDNKDNRRYPRIDHITSRQITRLDESQTPQRNYILTQNMSACGIKFTTNEKLEPATHFLIYLNDQMLQSMNNDSQNWFKLGDYYLSKVIWTQEIRPGFYEVGAGFLEKNSCSEGDIDTFTELVNLDMLQSLPDVRYSH